MESKQDLDAVFDLIKYQSFRSDDKTWGEIEQKESKIGRELVNLVDKLRASGRTTQILNDAIEDAQQGKSVGVVLHDHGMIRHVMEMIDPSLINQRIDKNVIEFPKSKLNSINGKIEFISLKSLDKEQVDMKKKHERIYFDHLVIELVLKNHLESIQTLANYWEKYCLDKKELDINIELHNENNKERLSPDKFHIEQDYLIEIAEEFKTESQEETYKMLNKTLHAIEFLFKKTLNNIDDQHEFFETMRRLNEILD